MLIVYLGVGEHRRMSGSRLATGDLVNILVFTAEQALERVEHLGDAYVDANGA